MSSHSCQLHGGFAGERLAQWDEFRSRTRVPGKPSRFYLGGPLAIPLKQTQSGALLLFTFFMITDPKTTPDRRSARILFAVLVAAAWLQFADFMPQAPMYALCSASYLVPLFDGLFHRDQPENCFEWSRPVLN